MASHCSKVHSAPLNRGINEVNCIESLMIDYESKTKVLEKLCTVHRKLKLDKIKSTKPKCR